MGIVRVEEEWSEGKKENGGGMVQMTLSTPSIARGGGREAKALGRKGFSADYVRFRPLIAAPSVSPISGSGALRENLDLLSSPVDTIVILA